MQSIILMKQKCDENGIQHQFTCKTTKVTILCTRLPTLAWLVFECVIFALLRHATFVFVLSLVCVIAFFCSWFNVLECFVETCWHSYATSSHAHYVPRHSDAFDWISLYALLSMWSVFGIVRVWHFVSILIVNSHIPATDTGVSRSSVRSA